jgi:hypothetical protein
VIVAHHLGEESLPTLVGAAAAAGPALLVVFRERLRRLFRR